MPAVTIGFFPREQFSLAAESLQRIFDYTRIPFNLIVIDCNTPKVYWQQIEPLLEGRSSVRVIHTDQYLMPNQSKTLVIQEADPNVDFFCFIENDVLVEEGWLSSLLQACEEHPADVAIPRIIEGRLGATQVHWDSHLGSIREVQTEDGIKLEFMSSTGDLQLDQGSHRRAINLSGEAHCQLFRRSVFDRVMPFDSNVVFFDWIDSSLALHAANASIVFEPESVVHFWHPYPPSQEDLAFFFQRWDLQQAARELDQIQKKWNLISLYADLSFAEERNHIGYLYEIREALKRLISPQESFILVDEDCLHGNEIIQGFKTIPFLEHHGQYWGAPADDEIAIREFERLRQTGASAIVFLWPAFWWFDYYVRFYDYLQQSFPYLLKNDHLIAFNLRP
ncbi:glycosyltransferase [Cyanobacteria bacterium FACHB-63]|nr:glycosyltransferase [Cyanobacteria bacterium FACHB-63]